MALDEGDAPLVQRREAAGRDPLDEPILRRRGLGEPPNGKGSPLGTASQGWDQPSALSPEASSVGISMGSMTGISKLSSCSQNCFQTSVTLSKMMFSSR